MLTHDDLADLAWFYSEQDGALGVRSPLGGQLDRLREGTANGTPPVILSDDSMTARQYAAAERANQIGRRLDRCSDRARAVFELQYGDAHKLHDHSVSLLAATQHAFVRWSVTRQSKRKTAFLSIRGYVLALGLREARSEECCNVLAEIVVEATRDLNAALGEYDRSRYAASA